MALELARAAAASRCVATAHKRVSASPLAWDEWADLVSAALEVRSVGTHREIALEVLNLAWRREIRREIDSHARKLARLTGLPVAASRTEAGWRKALETVLKKEKVGTDRHLSAAVLGELPGTEVVVLVHRIATLQEAGELEVQIARAWDRGTRKAGIEKEVNKQKKAGLESASRLAWAVIGFESHKHTNLIWHQANKLERVFPDREAADLLAYGWMGLRTALAKYDPDLGFAFSTYACTRITGSIRDGVRSESPIPKRLGTFGRKVVAAEAELTQAFGRAPTLAEVSSFLGTELDKLALMPRLAPQASIEEILEGSAAHGGTPAWSVDHEMSTEDRVEHSAVAAAIEDALKHLDGEEAEAVRLLVMEELHPTKARQIAGVSARQMRQRRDRGLEQLREFLAGWDPQISEPS